MRAATKRQKYDRISQKKLTIPIETMCEGLPDEFCIYLNHVRSLRFDDKPDYAYLRKLFRDVYQREVLLLPLCCCCSMQNSHRLGHD